MEALTHEILQYMHELQIRLTDVEINEPDKHKESVRRVYEQFIEICTGVTKEEMSQPVFSGRSALDFPELHEDSIPELSFFRACNKMMEVCCIRDFCMKDILQPESKRFKRHLSAIINFEKFRSERLRLYEELTGKRDNLLDRLRCRQEEEEMVARELQDLNAQTASEASTIESLQKQIMEAEAEIESLNEQQAGVRQETVNLKQKSLELRDRLTDMAKGLQEASLERERVRAQVVRSPERMRRELSAAAKEVENERSEGLAVERDAREIHQAVLSVQKAEKEVLRALTIIEEIEREVTKHKAAVKEIKESQRAISNNKNKISEASLEAQNLRRQLQRFEERMAKLRRQAKSKNEEIEAASENVHAAMVEVEKVKRDYQATLDEMEAEVQRLSHQLEGEKASNDKSREEKMGALSKLQAVVQSYQQRLSALLDDDEDQGPA